MAEEGALALARRMVARWNSGDFESIFGDWDADIVIRPDPYWPDSVVNRGAEAARAFWETQRETMGLGHLDVLEERDLGERSLMHIRQHVSAPASGVEGSLEWSIIVTARAGKVVTIEFFLDHRRADAAFASEARG